MRHLLVSVLESSSSLSTLLAGIDWILQQHDRSAPGVVNLSIEGPPSDILDARIPTLVEHGLVVVVAAGNGARSACDTSPARAAGTRGRLDRRRDRRT